MDGAEGLAAAAVWQLASELHERQAGGGGWVRRARTSPITDTTATGNLPRKQSCCFVCGVRGKSSRKRGSWIYVPYEAPDLVAASSDRRHSSHAKIRCARLQSFQLAGDTILDLLTDSPEAARLMDLPQGVMVEGRTLPPDSFRNRGFLRRAAIVSCQNDRMQSRRANSQCNICG